MADKNSKKGGGLGGIGDDSETKDEDVPAASC